MIALFTGAYFSKKHPYCTREYLAMRELETKCLARLGASVSKKNGLIVPVVIRNLDQMPAEMKRRMWSVLQAFQEDESGLARPKSYFEEIRKLVSYVAARYREMSALPDDELCNGFQLPNEERLPQVSQVG